MFQALIPPIFRSTKLCVTAWGITHPSCNTHRLVLLKMGGINARNMLSRLELLINCYCCISLEFISFIRSKKLIVSFLKSFNNYFKLIYHTLRFHSVNKKRISIFKYRNPILLNDSCFN
jgi:hypothetical protein